MEALRHTNQSTCDLRVCCIAALQITGNLKKIFRCCHYSGGHDAIPNKSPVGAITIFSMKATSSDDLTGFDGGRFLATEARHTLTLRNERLLSRSKSFKGVDKFCKV